jgi:hypothetical protein
MADNLNKNKEQEDEEDDEEIPEQQQNNTVTTTVVTTTNDQPWSPLSSRTTTTRKAHRPTTAVGFIVEEHDDNNNNNYNNGSRGGNHLLDTIHAKDEVDEEEEEYDERSPYTQIPPPGPREFTRWFSRASHDGASPWSEGHRPCGNDVEMMAGDATSDNNCHECNGNPPDRDPVRRFMGPIDDSLPCQLRRRREQHCRRNDAVEYETVSYKEPDTPVCT